MKRFVQLSPAVMAIVVGLNGGFLQAQSALGQMPDLTRRKPVVFVLPAPPPNTGRPTPRSGAAGRPRSCRQAAPPLTAIAPIYPVTGGSVVWTATTQAQPSFWFYVPYTAPSASAELILENAAKQQIRSKVTLPNQPGVMQVTPVASAVLATGQSYRWYFKVSCQGRGGTDGFVEGYITRRPQSAAVPRQPNSASLQQQLNQFATNGLWPETLSVAAKLQCADPTDPNWASLLQSVGLGELASAAIVDCRRP